jgi:SAM-dependent methyltransferase
MDTLISGNANEYYDERYFEWQRPLGEFGAQAQIWMFRDYIRTSDIVIDFGCGGGFLLDILPGRIKIGVEVNPAAQEFAQRRGHQVVTDLSEIPDSYADVLISSHALEHTFDPFEKLKLARRKLKPGGLAVLVVPCERYDTRYVEQNMDQHLYTWAPINIGNLVRYAGFTVESCERLAHRSPPKAADIQRIIGWPLFHALCRAYARLCPKLTQVRVVARKELHQRP